MHFFSSPCLHSWCWLMVFLAWLRCSCGQKLINLQAWVLNITPWPSKSCWCENLKINQTKRKKHNKSFFIVLLYLKNLSKRGHTHKLSSLELLEWNLSTYILKFWAPQNECPRHVWVVPKFYPSYDRLDFSWVKDPCPHHLNFFEKSMKQYCFASPLALGLIWEDNPLQVT